MKEHTVRLSCYLLFASLIQLHASLRLNEPLGRRLQNCLVPVQTLRHSLRLVFGHELSLDIDVICRNILEKCIAIANVNTSARDSLASEGVPRLSRYI